MIKMNKSTVNSSPSKTFITFILSSVMSGSLMASDILPEAANKGAISLYATPFDACLEMGNQVAEQTMDEAFSVAECFSSLLSDQESSVGANISTLIQYSTSWYTLAAEKGHKEAQVNLNKNLIALNQLDSSTNSPSGKLLASERTFHSLDLDKNGMLSEKELASNINLKIQLSTSDIDQDGQLSYGEYSIVAGEATASGK
jgi:TPR repeat protein